ncbi:hypothetical protein Bca52824_014031 [Brassica carinata]|uniref:Uncharacterized protein n=1 Tax=Brassica carinata TaxID=52824 RepID=A0A8X7W1W4_BRACI|nr:hypothetical protein Bca52824_014031 [Brassica carinata]
MIEGVLICSTNGTANPVSNATVFLTCDGSTISLAEAMTDLYGAFTKVLNIIQTLLIDPSFCGIGANLPNGVVALNIRTTSSMPHYHWSASAGRITYLKLFIRQAHFHNILWCKVEFHAFYIIMVF